MSLLDRLFYRLDYSRLDSLFLSFSLLLSLEEGNSYELNQHSNAKHLDDSITGNGPLPNAFIECLLVVLHITW